MSTPPPPPGNDPYSPYQPPRPPPAGQQPPTPYVPPPPGYAQGPYTQPGAFPGALQPANNGMAIASLIVGITSIPLSLCCIALGPVAGIVGVILGFVARNQINQSGGAQAGSGLALGGLICGGIGILIGVIFIVLELIFFGLSLFPLAQGTGG
ncbi:MAG TPA: DUF4190 domain-containing protein [Candidatus Binatia bacterium]|nr:DUF4190 domain-containing protein [Candidatus Binatia bacterium]